MEDGASFVRVRWMLRESQVSIKKESMRDSPNTSSEPPLPTPHVLSTDRRSSGVNLSLLRRRGGGIASCREAFRPRSKRTYIGEQGKQRFNER